MGEPDASRFLLKRSLRIFPALAFTVVVLAFVIGPLATQAPLTDYFGAAETWRFLLNVVFCSQYGTLPGVFETAPFAGRVDQSMWTLGFEAICYALIAALGAADRIVLGARYAILAAGALVFSFLFGGFLQVFAIAGTYLILYLAFAPLGPVRHAGRFGDFSYGVFLWGWPIQQMVEIALPETGPVANLIIALPIALMAAGLSWRLVEKPALGLRPHGPAPKRPVRKKAHTLAA